MKTNVNRFSLMLAAGCLAVSLGSVLAHDAKPNAKSGFVQVNLVSDIATNAPHVDPRLLNPWGFVVGDGALWVNDNGTGLMTVYRRNGQVSDFAVRIPAPGGGQGTPDGLVFNNTAQFVVTSGSKHAPATFLMATEDGTITAWNQRVNGTNAVIMVDNSPSGAVYKGLAIARDTNGAPLLFAANFHAGVVDVFDGQFKPLFSFTDTNLPPNFAPFNVRTIRGFLFVTFALQKLPDAHDDQAGPGNGFVDIFDTDGTLLRRFASQGTLNSPWGMAVAPSHFGPFSGALLVGNFGDGTINAFDLLTGKFLGQLADPNGNTIVIDGLWGLNFDREPVEGRECEFFATRLFFTAGLNDEQDGLLGFIRPAGNRFKTGH